MKKINLLFVIASVTMLGITSCSTVQHSDFSQRKYMKRFHTDRMEVAAVTKTEVTPVTLVTEMENTATVAVATIAKNDVVVEKAVVPTTKIPEMISPATMKNAAQVVTVEKRNQRFLPVRAKLAKAALKNKHQMAAEPIVEILLAIFIPPVGVLLHDDGITSAFWISLILTLLFWLPGAIYSLLYVTGSING